MDGGVRMIIHSGKRVICVKEIPSNMIEEAIFILKPSMVEKENEEEQLRSKEMILTEAEDIVEEYVQRLQEGEEEGTFSEELSPRHWWSEAIYIVALLTILAICIGVVM